MGQTVQGGIERTGHVSIRRLGPPQRRCWAGREFGEQRSEKIRMTRSDRFDKPVYVDAEGLLLKRASEDRRREVLQPRQQTQVQFLTTIPTQDVDGEENLLLTDFLSSGFALAELNAAFVQDSLDEELEQTVTTGFESGFAQFAVGRDEFGHHRAGLLEAVNSGCAGVPVLEFGVVGEAREREEQAELAVVVFGWAELFQGVKGLHCVLHGQLQLQMGKRAVIMGWFMNKIF